MNTKRRVLSFLMALVMVLGVMAVLPITVGAKGNHTDFDLRHVDQFIEAYDTAGAYDDIIDSYKRVDFVPYVTGAAPVLDGTIGGTEYTVTNPVKTHAYNTEGAPGTALVNGGTCTDMVEPIELREYFAQDATYLYIAFELPYYSNHCKMTLQIGRSSAGAYTIASDSNSNTFGMWNFKRVNMEVDTAGTPSFGATNATAPTWTAADVIRFKAPEGGSTTAYVEFKINKAELKTAVGAADANSFNYVFGYGAIREGAKSLNYVSNALLNDDVMRKANSEATGSTYYGRQICRNIGLVDYSAYENINVRTDLEAYGYRNYTVNGFASPSVNGSIANEEYTLVENTLATDVKNNMTGSDLVEYYAHDEDYVYYAFTMPYDGTSAIPSVYIRLAIHDSTAPESSYYNSLQIVLTAAKEAGESTFRLDNGRNVFPTYPQYHAVFVNGDVDFVGLATDDKITYELKISRDKMATIAGTESINDFAYYVSIADKWNCYDLSKEATLLKGLQDTRLFGTTKIGKNVKLVDPNMQTMNVGSVRIDTAETSGLRFQTIVSKAYLAEKEAEGYTVTAGTLIAPEDFNIAKHTDGTVNEDYIDVVANLEYPYDTSDKYITFTGAIVKINPGNLDRDFTAIGYLALTKGGNTEYVYSNAVTKNVSEIAQAAIDSGKYNEDPDALEILNGLLAN